MQSVGLSLVSEEPQIIEKVDKTVEVEIESQDAVLYIYVQFFTISSPGHVIYPTQHTIFFVNIRVEFKLD